MSENTPPEDDFESHRAAPSDGSSADRPDWLVGPDEGAAGEVDRNVEHGGPQLTRPSAPLHQNEPPQKKPSKPTAWTAAASSVPTLRRREDDAPNPPGPSFEPPAAEPEESWPGGPVTTSGASNALPASTQPAATPADGFPGDEFPMDDLPGGVLDAEGAADAPVRTTPTMQPLREPWHAIALDALRSNRVLQLIIAVGAIGFVVWKMWPSPVPTLPISHIHANPEGFDGRLVELHGRVGDVFPVGGGYAFYLHQGSDTIVVFTRSRIPTTREKVSVSGSVSTGYLDGVARPALFEETGE